MKLLAWENPSSEHEQVYHAASCCQAASLPLTARRLHDLEKVCSVEGKKTGGFASQQGHWVYGAWSVSLPGGPKDCRVIAGLGIPHPTECATRLKKPSR
jgi:hypothetical protein